MLSKKQCIFDRPLDVGVGQILALIGGGDNSVRKLESGIYEIKNFSGDMYIGCEFDEYPKLMNINCYGVCDNYKQVVEQEPMLQEDYKDKEFVVFVTPVRKSEQPETGGWRWHKWGPYIGNQKPQEEYLFNEPEIEEVFVYHIYELK